MEFLNRVSEVLRRSGPARFFLPLGLVLIISGVIFMGVKTDNYLETTGTVTSVTDLPYDPSDKDANQEYDVAIRYIVDGKEYEGVFNNLTGNYTVGQEMKVLYDPSDPGRIANGSMPGFVAPVLIGLGVLVLLYGGYKLIRVFR